MQGCSLLVQSSLQGSGETLPAGSTEEQVEGVLARLREHREGRGVLLQEAVLHDVKVHCALHAAH